MGGEDPLPSKSNLVTGSSSLSTVLKHMDAAEDQHLSEKKPGDEIQNDDDDADSILSTQTQRWLVIRRISYIVIVNAVMPILLYYALKPYLPLVWALVLSSTPTIISVLIQATFLRHIDTIGIASICGSAFAQTFVLPALMYFRVSRVHHTGRCQWRSQAHADARIPNVNCQFSKQNIAKLIPKTVLLV